MNSSDKHSYIVSIGASAGGIPAIFDLLGALPSPLAAPMVIALHSNERSRLTPVLQHSSRLNIKMAEEGETLEKGWIYVVPGATHLFFTNGRIQLSGIVKDSGFRPSIDALFMTMAAQYKEKAIGVVLSGTMKDGMRGAQIIYDMGGQTIVQDPKEAIEADMPRSVVFADHPEAVRSAKELGKWLSDTIGH